MELGKEPVIEAWIEFRFSICEETPPWNQVVAERFVQDGFSGQFKIREYQGHPEFKLERGESHPNITGGEIVFERLKASNETGDRYLQVGGDILICNLLRGQQRWPGYDTLEEHALDACLKYLEFRKPVTLSTLGLHYRDVIAIPLNERQQLDLNDYFTAYPKVPADLFPTLSRFRVSVTVAKSRGELYLDLRNDPVAPPDQDGNAMARFRMDWHIVSTETASAGVGWAKDWLSWAHLELRGYFHKIFTEQGWNLLDPKEA